MARIHLISVGGAVMHNIALAMQQSGHHVTGSDDEIYEPSKSRLQKAGLLPEKMGWDADRITPDLDYIILGMHATSDNPEISRAQELGIRIYSFPEFIYSMSKDKKRVVIGGSQGKTTTTSMIMWVLKKLGRDFDYLVGASVKGFDLMVRISDAPVIVIEGDEYLSSPMDRTSKFLHYRAGIAVITGIDWDHMNVFPTYDIYKEQFVKYIDSVEADGALIYFDPDPKIHEVIARSSNAQTIRLIPYSYVEESRLKNMRLFGDHNRSNLHAAWLVCRELGINDTEFWTTIEDFEGANKRLQILHQDESTIIYLDFAHAPAKLKATVNAVRAKHPDKKLYAIYELYTFSSLNKEYIPYYRDTINECDIALVLYNPHTLEMKKMPPLDKEFVKKCFGREDLLVLDNPDGLKSFISTLSRENSVFLFMSAGNFGGINISSGW